MVRVLLIIEDYSELIFLQSLLKKTGFDVDGIQSQKNLEEHLLSMNPKLVICSSKGKQISGLEVADAIPRNGGFPRVLLLVPNEMATKVRGLRLKNVDGLVDSPVDPESLLKIVAETLELDPDQILGKFEKLKVNLDPDDENDLQIMRRSQASTEELQVVKGRANADQGVALESDAGAPTEVDLKESSMSSEERLSRMKSMVESLPELEHDGFDRDAVKKRHLKIRKEEKTESKELRDLEEERQSFVKFLFSRK